MIALALTIPLWIPALWVLFLAVMNLERIQDAGTLPPVMLRPAKTVLYLGLFWDFSCNMVPVSLLFLELPHEWLVSARVQRHVSGSDGWRKRLALWFAVNMLNPFDPRGSHIRL